MVAVVAPSFVDQPVTRPAPPHLALYRPPPGRSLLTPARRHSSQVYRRRQIVALAALALVIVGAVSLLRSVVPAESGTGVSATRSAASQVWIVHPGDTLWSIARSSGDRGDILTLVDQLSAEVHGRPLQVGQRISLP